MKDADQTCRTQGWRTWLPGGSATVHLESSQKTAESQARDGLLSSVGQMVVSGSQWTVREAHTGGHFQEVPNVRFQRLKQPREGGQLFSPSVPHPGRAIQTSASDCYSCSRCPQPPPSPLLLFPAAQAAGAHRKDVPMTWLSAPLSSCSSHPVAHTLWCDPKDKSLIWSHLLSCPLYIKYRMKNRQICTIGTGYSKGVLWTSSTCNTCWLARNAEHQAPDLLNENLHFHKILRWKNRAVSKASLGIFLYSLTFEPFKYFIYSKNIKGVRYKLSKFNTHKNKWTWTHTPNW